MKYEEARETIGAYCVAHADQTKEWQVKMPNLGNIGHSSTLICPELTPINDDGQGLREYMQEPTDPVRCLSEEDETGYWQMRASSRESYHGGPGSTVDFWRQSSFSDRLTLGVRMHSTTAFLSMPNAQGTITGGATTRGFNDGSEQGYPLWLVLATRQVSDVTTKSTHRSILLMCQGSGKCWSNRLFP